jgi:hypothetical protein
MQTTVHSFYGNISKTGHILLHVHLKTHRNVYVVVFSDHCTVKSVVEPFNFHEIMSVNFKTKFTMLILLDKGSRDCSFVAAYTANGNTCNYEKLKMYEFYFGICNIVTKKVMFKHVDLCWSLHLNLNLSKFMLTITRI